MRFVVLAVVVVLVVLLSTFGIQNPTPVNVRFLNFQTGYVPIYVIMLISTSIGMLIMALLNAPRAIHHRLELRRLRQQVAALESQVTRPKEQPPVTGTQLLEREAM